MTLAATCAAMAAVAWGDDPDLQPRPGDPLAALTTDQLDRFMAGLGAYQLNLTPATGLGPVFNQTSCASCHNRPVGGPGSQMVTRFGLLDKKGGFDPLASLGGSLLQAQSISDDCIEVVPVEANITSLRVTPGALAYGLVEAITDADLLAVRDAQPESVRGEARMVTALEGDPEEELVGRFGWKAQVATVMTFSADAALNEMGLTSDLLPNEVPPQGDDALIDLCDEVPDPEDPPDGDATSFVQRVTDFQRYLAPPPQTPRSGMSGEVIFSQIGCAQCHAASFTTRDDASLEDAIRNVEIRPYGDFLLHSMGLAGDGIGDGPANGRQLRTPPLWGLRYRNPVWHDGRFGSGDFNNRMTLAIAEHGLFASQGQQTATDFAALSQSDKDLLIQFLDSLGRIEFDADGDDEVDLADVFGSDDGVGIAECFGSGCTPDDACAIHDLDQNGQIDAFDVEGFLLAFDDELIDCDGDGLWDLQAIIENPSLDSDQDGLLDACEVCTGDLDGSGSVDVNDVLALLVAWGDCPAPCEADLNDDGLVGVDDLLELLALWGDCP